VGDIKKIKKEEPEFMELGLSGLNRQSGYVFEEFLKELHGSKGVQIFKEMRDNDSTVGAVLFAIEMLIRQVDWRIEAASDSAADEGAEEFLNQCLFEDMDCAWDETLSEILSMLPFGWAYHEIVYKRRQGPGGDSPSKFNDGRVGWKKLPLRAQETLFNWEFNDDGSLKAMVQQAPPDYRMRTIPVEKSLLFRPKSHKNNPEGRSVLRNAYRDWYFKKHIENVEGIGIERDLAGLPCAFVPPEILKCNANTDAKNTLASIETMIKNIRRDEQEGLIFPMAYDDKGNKLFDIQLLSTGGSRQFDIDKVINRKDRAIAGTVLADFILLGHEKVGSKALSSDKTELFSVAIGTWLKSICEVFNNVAIPKLFSVNTFAIKEYPKLCHGDIETMDLKEVGEFINRMTASGAQLFPDVELENFLRKQASLPEVDEDARAETMAASITQQRGMVDQIAQAAAEGKIDREVAKEILSKALRIDISKADKLLKR